MSRFLRLDLDAMEWIEENVIPGKAVAINVVIGGMARTGFLKRVLQAALGIEKGKPVVSVDQVRDLYEAYIEKTGDRADLEKTLKDVYELAIKNPTRPKEPEEKKDPGGGQ